MASRCLLAAAVALCSLLATAAAKANPPPVTDPCEGNMTALSIAFTNATNTELAKKYDQGNTTSVEKPVKFTVPRFCPVLYCYGGKTYQATAGKIKTTVGEYNIVSDWIMVQTSCKNKSGTWTVSGTLEMDLTWTSPIIASMTFYVNGFLGVDLGFMVLASVSGLTADAIGTWTVTTTNGVTGTITAIDFLTCIPFVSTVEVSIDSTSLTQAANDVKDKILTSGPTLCSDLNKKLGPALIGKTIPL